MNPLKTNKKFLKFFKQKKSDFKNIVIMIISILTMFLFLYAIWKVFQLVRPT